MLKLIIRLNLGAIPMKNPLSYQSTEYDCGPTTLINAIRFLFEREDIPPELIKTITLYCLDGYSESGEAGKSGTTAMAMVFISSWLNQFGKIKDFPIYTSILPPEKIYIDQNSEIVGCLQQGGAAVVRVMLEGGHYVLLNGIDDTYIYLFDPYFCDDEYDDGIEFVNDSDFQINRRVKRDLFNNEGLSDYAFGEMDLRECMLIYNTKTRKTIDTIEYII
jgi:hypothetical protein